MGTKVDTDRTRGAMIEAAGELFSQAGYHGVTVREICTRAKASLSALNYHFRDKEGLYRAVLESAVAADALTPEIIAELESLSPRKGLLFLIQDYQSKLLASKTPPWRTLLIEREYMDPSPMFEEMLQQRVGNELFWIRALIAKAAKVPDGDETSLAAVVMFGVVSSLRTYRRVLEMLAPEVIEKTREGEALANLVLDLALRAARFSLPETGALPKRAALPKRGERAAPARRKKR
ncbi:MAG: CerR family C-terminal domain-containing protein [Planctomycetales bacterium]